MVLRIFHHSYVGFSTDAVFTTLWLQNALNVRETVCGASLNPERLARLSLKPRVIHITDWEKITNFSEPPWKGSKEGIRAIFEINQVTSSKGEWIHERRKKDIWEWETNYLRWRIKKARDRHIRHRQIRRDFSATTFKGRGFSFLCESQYWLGKGRSFVG